jgi:hypothetical protein
MPQPPGFVSPRPAVVLGRVLTEATADVERRDEFGFLDRGRTPRIIEIPGVSGFPATWVTAPPWLGKTTVASGLHSWLQGGPTEFGELDDRLALTELGQPGADRDIPPAWWGHWLKEPEERPAVWIIDGLDEGADHDKRLLNTVVTQLGRLSDRRRNCLRLVLFSRPHSQLSEFRHRLCELYPRYTDRVLREFTLARVDRGTAESIVGPTDFPRVLETIRRNELESVAGYPVVLEFLRRHPEADLSTASKVWHGVLLELVGLKQRDRGRPFQTEPEERFEAACRIAAILTLTRRETLREYSLAPDEPTIGSLFELDPGSNRRQKAAREVCRTAAFQALPEEATYRFAQRNAQDWLTAFALTGLPKPALIDALSDASGRLHPRLRETTRLIRAINPDPGLRAVIDRLAGGIHIPSDAVEPSLGQAIECLNRLEELARESDWGLRLDGDQEDGLARLGVPGLSGEIIRRLSDPTRPSRVKRLLIAVAEATRAVDAVETAVRMVLETAEDDGVRDDLMHFVCQLGGSDHLRELEIPIGEGPGSTDIDDRIRGALILELLRRGLWPAWRAACHAPRAARHVLDHRTILLHEIRERLTVADARRVLPHFLSIADRHHDDQDIIIPKIINHEISLIFGEAGPAPADIQLLERLTLDMLGSGRYWSEAFAIGLRLRHIPEVRLRFYQFDAERLLRGESATSLGRRVIAPEDVEWLRQRARGEWPSLDAVWSDLVRLGESARQGGRLSETAWRALIDETEERFPGLPARIEADRRLSEEEAQRWQSEMTERKAKQPKDRPLAEIVREVLSGTDRPEADRMRDLGFVCFHPNLRSHLITGTWEDLPGELREDVLRACRIGLETGDPSPLAEGNSLSGRTCGEAAAFETVVTSEGAHVWMTGDLIRRWLPIALHAPLSGGSTDLIRACWSVSQGATEQALADAVVDVVRRFGRPPDLLMIPSECWAEVLSERVIGLVLDESLPATTRGELLEILATRDLDRSLPTAEQWAYLPFSATPKDQLRRAGRNVFACRDPAAVLDLVEREFAERRAACLEELTVLVGGRDRLHAGWDRWPLDCRERLLSLLVRAYPLGDDPEDYAGGWGTNLRWLRSTLIGGFLRDGSAEDSAALNRLSGLDPELHTIVLARRASNSAAQVLRGNAPGATSDPSGLPLQTARQLLERKDFRLVRSEDDLQEAVLFALDVIQREVGYDLALLYAPAKKMRVPKGATRPAPEPEREHVREDALQAYLRRRLSDVLAGVAEGVEVQILREDQVSYRRKFDLRVTAPCLGTRRSATVVIEVKWSTNPETRSALTGQLGRQYLLGEGLTHGVFLVGWAGWWQPGNRKPKGRDLTELSRFLNDQRDSFCGEGRPGGGIRIEPIVLDLSWRQTAIVDNGNGGRTSR